ncbi:MAG TPA: ornithine--oxo-acid transaminase [Alphaproteobacteria bacterium]
MTHDDPLALEARYAAKNYAPLPVVIARGEGVWLYDVAGRRYLDMLAAYSATSFGHGHAKLVAALKAQVDRVAVVSRAFHSDMLGPFLARACERTGQDGAVPMNTGAEAVETALKAARKWGYAVKGIAPDRAEIIACTGNFHGRTIAVVGLSSEPQYRDGFGPFPPGFALVPFGDAGALERAITPNTAAFLVEPIQGEGGVNVPPAGFLARAAEICRRHNVLLIADEVQTGMGRTGKFLACDHDGVKPDGLVLGKALGGGLLPVSLFLARRDVIGVFRPGDHGSTFGGNPLAAAVGSAALDILFDEGLIERAAEQGAYLMQRLRALNHRLVREVRGRGLLIGVEFTRPVAREICYALMQHGVLAKEARGNVVRFSPPLVIARAEIDWAAERIAAALNMVDGASLAAQ